MTKPKDDSALLEAEREIERLVALPDVGGNIPAKRCHAWNDRRDFIVATPAVGLIGVAVKLSHGRNGAVVRASVAALSTSRIATPPLPSAKA